MLAEDVRFGEALAAPRGSGQMGEGARGLRVLIAYEESHRVYAEAMQHALRGLRPAAEVATCGIDELGAGVKGFDPDLVVSSRPNTVEPGRRTAW